MDGLQAITSTLCVRVLHPLPSVTRNPGPVRLISPNCKRKYSHRKKMTLHTRNQTRRSESLLIRMQNPQ
ncbi:hypothetical protein BGZ61DRAFT_68633 [Ilyonectria robusta]|uniref:uncharacterized protein n=1 Tax=Ilyonectria robusta TaxID=1079257 RepID=UPI001E8E3B2F|nr:uncharacterized protein BGZ61DRAFT_68633 [Ilyonectria robusta]KAH8679176.1 hypothetical protein BGZ61DRAFT_68633 [Ilyonectria robusta]